MMPRRNDELDTTAQTARDIAYYDYMQPNRQDSETTDLGAYLSMIVRRIRLIAAIAIFIFAAGMSYTLSRRPTYESSAKVAVVGGSARSSASDADLPLVTDVRALTGSRTAETQVEIMSSPDLLQEAFERLDERVRSEGFGKSAIPDWAWRISKARNADVIVVTGRAHTPAAAAELANTIAETYFTRDLEQSGQAIRQARQFAEEKSIDARKQLEEAQAELANFKKRTGLFSPDIQLTKSAEQMAQIRMEMDAAAAEAVSSRQSIASLRSELAAEQKDVVTNTTLTRNPQFSAALERLDRLKGERTSLSQEYTPNSREIRSMDERIRQEEDTLKRIAVDIVGSKTHGRNPVRDSLLTKYAADVAANAAATARVEALRSELDRRRQEAQSLPERERGLTWRVQRVSVLQRTYEMLSTKYLTLLFSEQFVIPNGTLVSRALTPTDPNYPKTAASAVIFLLLGMAVGTFAAVLVDKLDMRLRNDSPAEELCGLPALSMVPDVRKSSDRILTNDNRDPALLESFRILRNNLRFSSENMSNLRILAITSPGRNEGKSMTCLNLATAMAMDGKRVLLVDGDLRCPSLHRLLEIDNECGLSCMKFGLRHMKDCVRETRMPNIFLMPAGPAVPNPAEMLGSQTSKDFFKAMSDRFDMIIVDCPPTAGLSDVQIISTIVDGVLLVVSMNHTLRPHLAIALKMLAQARAPIVGMAVNRVDTRRGSQGYYYYGQYKRDEASDDSGS